jgi:protein-tyrosine phosphatase
MKTENSQTSPIRVVKIVPTNEAGGWVAISLAPGKKALGTYVHWDRDLETDLNRLKELGVTTLAPFLTDDELKRLKIPNLIVAATKHGFAVLRFPFRDGGIPENLAEAVQFVKDVIECYEGGERVLMHCNGGLGRAGTMAACVRIALGNAEGSEIRHLLWSAHTERGALCRERSPGPVLALLQHVVPIIGHGRQ